MQWRYSFIKSCQNVYICLGSWKGGDSSKSVGMSDQMGKEGLQ